MQSSNWQLKVSKLSDKTEKVRTFLKHKYATSGVQHLTQYTII